MITIVINMMSIIMIIIIFSLGWAVVGGCLAWPSLQEFPHNFLPLALNSETNKVARTTKELRRLFV